MSCKLPGSSQHTVNITGPCEMCRRHGGIVVMYLFRVAGEICDQGADQGERQVVLSK